MQDVQDNDQKTQSKKDREKKPLPQLVLQIAAVHGRTRLRAQRHRGGKWGRSTNPTLHARAKSTYRAFSASCR
jgi:hypothetical protein